MLDRRVLVRLLPLVLCAACHAPSGAPAAAKSPARERLERRLADIFETPDYTPKSFGPARWVDARSYLTVEESATLAGGTDLVRYDAASGARSLLIAAQQLVPSGAETPLTIEDYAFSADGARVLLFTNTRKVWRDNTRGDYWVLELASGKLTKLGGDAPEASLLFAKLAPDGTRVGYVRGNDLYVEDLPSGALTRLTSDGSATTINGTSDWVYEEEFSLRDAWRWSPDGQSIAFWHFDSSGVPLYTLVNTTVALYPTLTTIPYPKAGQTNSAVKLGVIAAMGGDVRWVELPGDPRQMYVPRMEWVPGANELLVQQLDRRQQHNTVWRVDATSGKAREFFGESEPTAWLDVVDDWRWLQSGELLWISERDGWRHAWALNPAGQWRCVTPGDYDLTAVVDVDEARGALYVQASPDDATRRYLYRVPLAGGPAERVTPAGELGTHTYDPAPGAGFALHTSSSIDRAPAVELVRLPEHARVRVLEDNAALNAKLAEFIPLPTEFLRLDIGAGVVLDGWLMRPRDFDPAQRYPLVTFVYNEPSNVQANDVWKGVRGGLFNHALAEAGYVVVCVDTQGTPGPRGTAWRKSTYQRFGPLGSDQQAAAVRALCAERAYLDPARVAVWGWSGGGTMTLNQLFRHPEIYQVGMSVAPVPDVSLYDSVYQERYTGLPETDAAAYRLNSPLTYAEGLQGKLLLVHGSGDDNVHFQGSERLIDRLVELGKSFDFMLYPNRSHAINEGPGTLHHVFALLARYLEEHLPAGPR
ncbi:MAG: S9 family peptidase [Planctomycetes bacterium]|nr:S9 family peptidase [Planctomycetota bacterium]